MEFERVSTNYSLGSIELTLAGSSQIHKYLMLLSRAKMWAQPGTLTRRSCLRSYERASVIYMLENGGISECSECKYFWRQVFRLTSLYTCTDSLVCDCVRAREWRTNTLRDSRLWTNQRRKKSSLYYERILANAERISRLSSPLHRECVSANDCWPKKLSCGSITRVTRPLQAYIFDLLTDPLMPIRIRVSEIYLLRKTWIFRLRLYSDSRAITFGSLADKTY